MSYLTLYQGCCCGFSVLVVVKSANDKVLRKSIGHGQCHGEGQLTGRAEVRSRPSTRITWCTHKKVRTSNPSGGSQYMFSLTTQTSVSFSK